MKTCSARLVGVAAALALTLVTVRAQFVVYDPSNYFEAVAEYAQLVRQYELLLQQASQLPVSLFERYHTLSLPWTMHDVAGASTYVQALLTALNQGDSTGAAYRLMVGTLDDPADVVATMPLSMRQRLATAYAAVGLADSVNQLAVDQAGTARADEPTTLQVLDNVEADATNPEGDFQGQVALLEKINAALAIDLRLNQQTNQFQLSTLEQALIDTTRKRDTEAALVNATIYQWRYGQAYGASLFRQTAADLDGWRPY